MDYKCNIELKGDLIDSLRLTSVLDEILDSGAACKIKDIKINEEKTGNSYVRLSISSDNKDRLDEIKNKIISKYSAKPVIIVSKSAEVRGHILDSLTLAKILDIIANNKGRCEIKDIKIGVNKNDLSFARINISTLDGETMDNIIEKIKMQGAVVSE